MKKDQHIKYALECENIDSLKDIRLKYFSLPSINPDDVDISTKFCNMTFAYPIYINAITGGSEKGDEINKRLEYIANKTNIFMFSGSYTPALKGQKAYYPKNVGANIGADKNISQMKKVVEETNAKILQIHLNPIQEVMMIDGETQFNTWEKNIKEALKEITVPIIIKETGFGMSKECIEYLFNMGVKAIDISSKGGTNFSYIEDKRANKAREYMYELGYTLKESLINSREYIDKIDILASGGIENSIQIVKCLAMGAKAVGISAYILKLLQFNTDDEIVEKLKEMIYEIKGIMSVLNSSNLAELIDKWEEKI